MRSSLTVALVPGVWRIRLIGDFVNGFIFRDNDGQVTLLDMGVARSGKKVMAALESIGSGPSDVTRLMLTHAHTDHAGGAAYVSEQTGRPVDAHVEDAPYLRSGTLPPTDNAAGGLLGRVLGRLPKPTPDPVEIGEEFVDGQVVPVAGGLRVIHTPGHSPGHMSLLHQSSGLLITGDAIFNVRGLRWPVRSFCTDFAMTQQTAHRLAEEDYSLAAFTHGPELRENPREHIRRFLSRSG